jgi:hypothetical protein
MQRVWRLAFFGGGWKVFKSGPRGSGIQLMLTALSPEDEKLRAARVERIRVHGYKAVGKLGVRGYYSRVGQVSMREAVGKLFQKSRSAQLARLTDKMARKWMDCVLLPIRP